MIRAKGGLLGFSLTGREVSAWQRISRLSGPLWGKWLVQLWLEWLPLRLALWSSSGHPEGRQPRGGPGRTRDRAGKILSLTYFLGKRTRQYFDRGVCDVGRNISGIPEDAALAAFVL